jgi:hypothetical protein
MAVRVLERVGEADDAYILDMRTGFRVAIGQQKAAAERVREVHGQAVVWVTPDEVAAVIANVDAFKPIAAIKHLFPGAEMLEVHPHSQPRMMNDWGSSLKMLKSHPSLTCMVGST